MKPTSNNAAIARQVLKQQREIGNAKRKRSVLSRSAVRAFFHEHNKRMSQAAFAALEKCVMEILAGALSNVGQVRTVDDVSVRLASPR
jgi:hypothetical protein